MSRIARVLLTLSFCLVLLGAARPQQVMDQESPLSVTDTMMASELSKTVSTFEWLGPLAPVAISPFFGITCLAFMSQYDFVPGNSFVSNNPVLQNPAVLWTFLLLTVVTSLPRLTKVSKPLAQAIDQLEAYSGIITLIGLRMAMQMATDGQVDPAAADAALPIADAALPMGVVTLFGFWTLPLDILMSAAAALNIVVINTVKFFFEVMVWITPFPFVDAMLEAANKSLCAGLMALYAYSPLLATILNLLIFVACLLVFFWIRRRVVYMRTILLDPIWGMVNRQFGIPAGNGLVVFSKNSLGEFPSKAKLLLTKSDRGWRLTQHRWLRASRVLDIEQSQVSMEIHPGLLINEIQASGGGQTMFLLFSRRYSDQLPLLAEQLGCRLVLNDAPTVRDLGVAG